MARSSFSRPVAVALEDAVIRSGDWSSTTAVDAVATFIALARSGTRHRVGSAHADVRRKEADVVNLGYVVNVIRSRRSGAKCCWRHGKQ